MNWALTQHFRVRFLSFFLLEFSFPVEQQMLTMSLTSRSKASPASRCL
jgi:hypothetical protein